MYIPAYTALCDNIAVSAVSKHQDSVQTDDILPNENNLTIRAKFG